MTTMRAAYSLFLFLVLWNCPSTATTVRDVQDYFDENGFTMLPGFLGHQRDTLEQWKIFADHFFGDTFQQLYDKGLIDFPRHRNEAGQYALEEGASNGYREIVMRSSGRYEISLVHNNSKVEQQLRPSIEPILQRLVQIVPYLLHTSSMQNIRMHYSMVISTPGAPEQSWHTDGEHLDMAQHQTAHCINAFIPLVPISRETGPTELYPASHYITRQVSPMKIHPDQLQDPVAPPTTVSDALFFDFRVLHRYESCVLCVFVI